MQQDRWKVYLAGEIHTDWRDQLIQTGKQKDWPIKFVHPQLDHATSDDCGVRILGEEGSDFWKDHKGSRMNALRNDTLVKNSDMMVVRFGEKYRQWNAAFDAGRAQALGIPFVVWHPEEFNHALKEIDSNAHAVCNDFEQVVATLHYACRGELA